MRPKKTKSKLTTEQKHSLAKSVQVYECIWKIDHELYQRPLASEKAFLEISKSLQLTVEECRDGWDSLKQAVNYQLNVKQKRKKGKSGDPNDFDDTQESQLELDDEKVVESWEFYDSLKFYVDQKAGKKRRTTDSYSNPETGADIFSQDEINEAMGETDKDDIRGLTDDESQSVDPTSQDAMSQSESTGISVTPKGNGISKSKTNTRPSTSSNYAYSWLHQKKEEKEVGASIASTLKEFVDLRKERTGSTSAKVENTLKFYSMYLNLDRSLKKLPDVVVERLNLKFQQMVLEELEKINEEN